MDLSEKEGLTHSLWSQAEWEERRKGLKNGRGDKKAVDELLLQFSRRMKKRRRSDLAKWRKRPFVCFLKRKCKSDSLSYSIYMRVHSLLFLYTHISYSVLSLSISWEFLQYWPGSSFPRCLSGRKLQNVLRGIIFLTFDCFRVAAVFSPSARFSVKKRARVWLCATFFDKEGRRSQSASFSNLRNWASPWYHYGKIFNISYHHAILDCSVGLPAILAGINFLPMSGWIDASDCLPRHYFFDFRLPSGCGLRDFQLKSGEECDYVQHS